MRSRLLSILLIPAFIFLSISVCRGQATPSRLKRDQKIIILMLDGFGVGHYRGSDMPALNYMQKHGLFKVVGVLMPSATNVNTTSICTGELPEKHGITGNSFYDPVRFPEEFIEDDSLVLSPTIFERAKKKGCVLFFFQARKKRWGFCPGIRKRRLPNKNGSIG